MRREDLLTPEICTALSQHAIEEYPKESIGIITNRMEYKRLVNISPNPTVSVRWSPLEFAKLLTVDTVKAVVHSHPGGPNSPSSTDMRTQDALNLPFVIVSTNGVDCLPPIAWGGGLEPPPLLGRPYIHGVFDCYSLIKDFYQTERGVILPEFPRGWDWWNSGEALYEEGFEQAGFRTIAPREVQDGDVVLFTFRSKTANHGAVVADDKGLIIHHPASKQPYEPGRLSRSDVLGRYLPHATHWLRYEG